MLNPAAILRLLGSFALAAAVAAQLLRSVTNETAGTGQVGYVILNFLSFFTVESNLMAIAVLGLGALFASGLAREPRWFGTARASVTTYMVVTGLVYNFLLRGIELPQGTTVGWSNEVLHVAGPAIMLLDWLMFTNAKRVPLRSISWIIIFPLAWVTYTLARGALTIDPRTGSRWYPYPFLNPELSATAYLSVVVYVVLIAGVIGLVGLAVLKTDRLGRLAHPTSTKVPA